MTWLAPFAKIPISSPFRENCRKLKWGSIIIHDTGAHGHSMGYNYNGRLRHQEIMVHEDGTVQQIRRNETLHDLFATLTYPELHENVDKLEK